MNVIEAHNMTKIYGPKTVVNNVNLIVKKGEIYGFLGRNGAGKSTFINMITGIVRPTSGEFKLLNESKLDKVYHRIGVLPDYSTFYDSLTALGHLKYYSKINGYSISTKEGQSILDRVGLLEHANKKAGKFSFGMKKKLGIAQAIVHNPELIFLDEPTSGIDAESGLNIQQLILDLKAEGKTIFMTSHNLNEVEKICTRMAIMKDGSILNEGTLEDLRMRYSSSIEVEIKHSAFSNREIDLIPQFLNSIGKNVKTKGNKTSLVVNSEEKIPSIVRALTNHKIDIYRLNVNEPSLEEIFLDKRKEKKKIS
ncbi:ABC transporter ATP-binding protein [Bacillus aquiflavi]|uniref:ABC transporter ATP-binding protein n=1 Tax=Bacillus aquiflavi TaxID=2672567 RepID=A0A6B3VRT2_9BACI|nr:ABC transporter ATP-binding protein [Bacillus aquiflavi]MBA4536341.1 ABC transporter ATP-binding protein [Bacillus aquiflavi]NEY80709.1 ABC transporter ATP-binding protein [Bacillus aquiflavi]UAC48039.1 ABC transporter ATP-binding protein [Bacillus aquiflavi]